MFQTNVYTRSVNKRKFNTPKHAVAWQYTLGIQTTVFYVVSYVRFLYHINKNLFLRIIYHFQVYKQCSG